MTAGQDALVVAALTSAGVSVICLGWGITYRICDAESLCPRWLRDLPAHVRELAAVVVAAFRQALVWAGISLLLLASPHTPETNR